jgi:hypothetical protein
MRSNGIPKVFSLSLLTATAALIGAGGPLQAQDKKPDKKIDINETSIYET